ncbi:hypothetical protein OH687_21730 [Burkholderia anthina]|nr:hypothetical protein OH687_21730 [Burkholderia anthina]
MMHHIPVCGQAQASGLIMAVEEESHGHFSMRCSRCSRCGDDDGKAEFPF